MCNHTPKHAKGLCKKCYKLVWRRKNKQKIKDQWKTYYKKHRVRLLANATNYHWEHKEEHSCYSKEYRQKNYQKILKREANYRKTHKKLLIERYNVYKKKRLLIDPAFSIAIGMRIRLNHAIKNKSQSTKELVGCDWSFLVAYLESKFKEGMTWQNRNMWHIDHIRPLSSFDLSDPEQQRKACHYTNLQPLWAKDNIRKGNKICT